MMTTITVPDPAITLINTYRAGECATLTKAGELAVVPILGVWDAARATVVFFTAAGLAQKAFNARRHPQVSVLFSDASHSGLASPGAVLAQGDATVTEDLAAQRLATFADVFSARLPGQNYRADPIMRRLMDWYYVRLAIDVAPRRLLTWDDGDTRRDPVTLGPPLVAVADGTVGAALPWDRRWTRLARGYASAVITVLGADGYPVSWRCQPTLDDAAGVARIDPAPPALRQALASGAATRATLLFHRFGASMKQETMAQFQLRGALTLTPDGALTLRPARFVPGMGSRVADQPVGWEKLTAPVAFIRDGKRNTRRYLRLRGLRAAE